MAADRTGYYRPNKLSNSAILRAGIRYDIRQGTFHWRASSPCWRFLKQEPDETGDMLGAGDEKLAVIPRDNMDHARPQQQTMPRHLRIKESDCSRGGHNYLDST